MGKVCQMTNKPLLFSILLFIVLFIAGCVTSEPTATPTVVDVAVVTGENTAVSTTTPIPTSTPQPTPSATPSQTPTSTPTLQPTPTATGVFSLPSSSIIFVQDNTLKQWVPQTDEIKTLTENVDSRPKYANDIAMFFREITPEEDEALIIFHIPTQTEHEVFRTSTTPLARIADFSLTISPNGRWLAYASAKDSQTLPTIFVHEISVEDNQLVVSSPILTFVTNSPWSWPHEQFYWATPNELSWSDENGIWLADLDASPIEPIIVVQPSTNTYKMPSLNPSEQNAEPSTVYTKYFPHEWSPNGRYLLATEEFFEYGEYRVIERETNRILKIPNSETGTVVEETFWLNEHSIVHFDRPKSLHIWNIDFDTEPQLSLAKTITLEEEFWALEDQQIVDNHLRFTYYGSDIYLYDLDLATGEFLKMPMNVPLSLKVMWAPNAQFVFWSYTEIVDGERAERIYLTNLKDGSIKNMENIFGLNSCCHYWHE